MPREDLLKSLGRMRPPLSAFAGFVRRRCKLLSFFALALLLALLVAIWFAWTSLGKRATLLVSEPTILVEDKGGRFIAEVGPTKGGRGFWPPPSKIPPRVIASTLAAEDARFFSHGGVDPRSVARALVQNLRAGGKRSGASTIAMQVARIQHPSPRTFVNKLAEAAVARALVSRFGRMAVLRHYLTIAPYGNQCCGIAYAARKYLDKPLEDLTWAEAALLSSLPRLPGRMNLYSGGGRMVAERRARHVLGRLSNLGWITPGERAEALEMLPHLELDVRETRPESCLHAALLIGEELKNRGSAIGKIPAGTVRSSIDLDLQEEVSLLCWRAMEKYRPEGAGNIAAVVVEKVGGRVRAYVGSENYFDEKNRGAIDYARALRSSGSTLKPFVYAFGMERCGFTAATLLEDAGLCLDARNGGYVVKNYDGAYLGPILYRNALANSRNVPAVQVLQSVGIQNTLSGLGRLGLGSGGKGGAHYGVGLAIGGLYVRLLDLARAYGVLANDGRAFDLGWFEEGDVIGPRGEQLMREDVAREITLFLSDPMARIPTFPRMGALEYPFPVAVKTGTSQGCRDAWCIAYSEKYIVGVWIGHPDNYPMNRTCGANSSAEVVHSIMEKLHPGELDGGSERSFPPPRGFVPKRVCMLTGRLASGDSPYVAIEWFRPGSGPASESTALRRVRVDSRSGRPAGEDCPPEFVRQMTYVDLAPRFAAWAKESGLETLPPEFARPEGALLMGGRYTMAITRPHQGAVFVPDPESPASSRTIALEAVVSPPVPQVVWFVDGKPFKVERYPYSTRWPMIPGTHVFQIRLPFAEVQSPRVKVAVR